MAEGGSERAVTIQQDSAVDIGAADIVEVIGEQLPAGNFDGKGSIFAEAQF